MSGDQPIILDRAASAIGQPCPVCHQEFAVGDRVVMCPRCKQAHHAKCWQSHGGCARHGCAQLATGGPVDRERLTDDDRAKQYQRPLPKWIPWSLVLLGLFVIVGIPVLKNTVFADKRPKLTVMIPALSDQQLIEEIVREFGELHPDLQVQTIAAPYGPDGSLYEQKLAILIGARDAPDIFALPWGRFSVFAEQGVYADLSSWITSDPEALDGIPQERLERGRVNGVWYGVPHPARSAFFGVFRNSERIDEAIALLERIISSIPVDEEVYDAYRVETWIPQIRFMPGL